TPVLALKEWQQKRPELFVKRVYDQTGLDSYRSLVNEGASLYQVQLLLGHASSVTTQRYAHLASSTLRNTSQLVSNLVNQS
ncbi:tyrosine-type recombinase/integrase, partial [Massilia arenae]